jgi:hypothetical protein
MVKGLYYHVTKQLIPSHYLCDWERIDSSSIRTKWEEMEQRGGHAAWIKPDVFACQYYMLAQLPLISRWLLLFYNTILFEVETKPPNFEDFLVRAEPTATTRMGPG